MERTGSDANSNETAPKAIAFDDLGRTDRVLFQTSRSNYQFAVLDPSNRKGMLTGGLLGSQTLEAVLTGTLSEDRSDFDSTELKTGARAVFFLGPSNHLRRLTTSVIIDIVVAKDCVGGKTGA